MKIFPRNYKNCFRYINENYSAYKKVWHINWKQDKAIYIIKEVSVKEREINIWINIWLLIKDTKNLQILKSCLDIAGTDILKSQIVCRWLTLYSYALYPELLKQQKHIYRNGEIFFSQDDYCNKTLSAIEQFIRQSFGQYRVSVDLEYINHQIGNILGDTKLNQTLIKPYSNRLMRINGVITFRMLIQESVQKLRLLYEKISTELAKLSSDLQITFNEILVVIDNGFETLNLGQKLNNRSLSTSFGYKVIKNENI